MDHHDYYTSRFIEQASEADSYWFELSSLIGSGVEVQDENVVESIIQGFHRYYEVSCTIEILYRTTIVTQKLSMNRFGI